MDQVMELKEKCVVVVIITTLLLMCIKTGLSSFLSAISLIIIVWAGFIKYLAGK